MEGKYFGRKMSNVNLLLLSNNEIKDHCVATSAMHTHEK